MKDKMRRRLAYWHREVKKKTLCINCKQLTHGCFVPPSFGEPGFFICKKP